MRDGIAIESWGPQDLPRLLLVAPGLFDEDIRPEEAAAFLADPANLLLIAVDEREVVGMATGTVLRHPDKPPQLFVNELGVRESHQRQGIARALVAALRAAAAARGCAAVWVATEGDNLPARALYRTVGGEETEGVAVYVWDEDD